MKNTLHSVICNSTNISLLNFKKRYLFLVVFALIFSTNKTLNAQVTITSDSFESGFGWGNWNDGGYDCLRVFSNLINGNFNILLRDDSGNQSSMYSDPIDISSYSQVNIEFEFYIRGVENGESFYIEYNNGANTYLLEEFEVGAGYSNNRRYSATVIVSSEDYVMGTNSVFRITSDASDNGDRIYIDDINIIGYTPPSNDNCSNAIDITPKPFCETTFSTTYGTLSSNPFLSGCSGSADDDIWFSFTATNTEHDIRVAGSSLIDPVFEIFDGGCGSGSFVDCIDTTTNSMELATITGLSIGNTYYIRVYSNGSNARNRGEFSICITEPCTTSNTNGSATLSCPSVDGGGIGLNGADVTINCSDTGASIEANFLNLGETSSYNVESIPYNPPFQFNCLENPVSVNIDDRWSDVINLPFDFCFYGNTYNSCVVGSNGVISFDTSLANGSSGWRITENIPNLNNASGNFFGPSIYGVHHDVDPSVGGEIGWQLITLDSGCQALVAAWSDVPMYNDYSKLYSGMIVFYENTNIIEVYVKDKNIDSTWNNGNATIGLQADENEAISPPGRNSLNTDWAAYNEAWRFTPNGNSITELKWYANSIAPSNEIVDPNDDGQIDVAPNQTTSYFAEVTYNLCTGGTIKVSDEIVVTIDGRKTWNGSQSNDWNNPNNWTPVGVPVPTNCILIPDTGNNPVMSGTTDGVGYNLEINDNASLTQLSDATLTIEDEITISSNGNLEIRDNASIIQITDVATNNNSGSAKVQREVLGVGQYDYVYWSSPVDAFNVQSISPITPNFAIYKWNPTVANGTIGQHGTWENTAENMSPGKGYIVRGLMGTPIANTAEFIGTLNNGQVSYPISRGVYTGGDYPGIGNTATAEDDNWNLIGNPYPSSISLSDFIAANPQIDGTLYFWRHLTPASSAVSNPFYENYTYNYSSSDYLTANSLGTSPFDPNYNGYIASGQGFFALMLDSAATPNSVNFSNTMRGVYANDNFYRNSSSTTNNEKHRIWLDLVDEDNLASSILVGYANGASDEMDRLYDGILIGKSGKLFYSVLSDKKLSINGKALPFENTDLIPLGYKAANSGNLTISINSLDGLFGDINQGIYLEDKELSIIHNLRSQPYSFTTDEGTFNNRFVLRFTNNTLSTNEQQILSNVTVKAIKNVVKATSTLSAIKAFELFDITGRIIHKNFKVNNNNYLYKTNNLSNGNYIVKILLDNGSVLTKKVIL